MSPLVLPLSLLYKNTTLSCSFTGVNGLHWFYSWKLHTEAKFCIIIMWYPAKPMTFEPNLSFTCMSSLALLSTSTSLKQVCWHLKATSYWQWCNTNTLDMELFIDRNTKSILPHVLKSNTFYWLWFCYQVTCWLSLKHIASIYYCMTKIKKKAEKASLIHLYLTSSMYS